MPPPPTLTPLAQAALKTFRRFDAWQNVITGLGVPGTDKRTGADFKTTVLGPGDCEALHRSDDMAARVAELLPKEMTREWLEVQVKEDDEQGDALGDDLDRLEAREKFCDGMIWSRVYGGAGILVGARDGQADPIEPLNEEAIQSVDWLNVFDSRELIAVQWYGDPGAAKYGEPEIYRVQPLTVDLAAGAFDPQLARTEAAEKKFGIKGANEYGYATYVHESRVIAFHGSKVSRRQMRFNHGWSDSIYVRVLDEIRDFQTAFDSANVLVQDFAQAVVGIKGLAEILAANDSATFQNRMAALHQARSVLGAYLIDADGETFERKATPIEGLSDLLEQFALRLAAAIEVPVSLLMGQAPAGLNATGDTDVRWLYSRVKSRQNTDLCPAVKRLVTLLAKAKRGPTNGKVPEKFSIVPRPLWALSDLEESERRL
jgi:phage-related protein (TIGR01555 family)